MHGIVTHVIDKNGQWRANFHGLDFKPINWSCSSTGWQTA
jgi:protein SCO1/2